jgi:hypothetical protein
VAAEVWVAQAEEVEDFVGPIGSGRLASLSFPFRQVLRDPFHGAATAATQILHGRGADERLPGDFYLAATTGIHTAIMLFAPHGAVSCRSCGLGRQLSSPATKLEAPGLWHNPCGAVWEAAIVFIVA